MFITKNLDFFILLCIGVFVSFTSAIPRNPSYESQQRYRPAYPQNALSQGYPGRSESIVGPKPVKPHNVEYPIGSQKPGYPKQIGPGIQTPSVYPTDLYKSGSQLINKSESPQNEPKNGSQLKPEYQSGSPPTLSYPVLPVMPQMPTLPNMPAIYGKQMPRSLMKMFPQLVPYMGYESFNLTVQRFPIFFMNPNDIKN